MEEDKHINKNVITSSSKNASIAEESIAVDNVQPMVKCAENVTTGTILKAFADQPGIKVLMHSFNR